MLAILAYLKVLEGRPAWFKATLILYASAVLFKGVAVTLPAVLLILDSYRDVAGNPRGGIVQSFIGGSWLNVPGIVPGSRGAPLKSIAIGQNAGWAGAGPALVERARWFGDLDAAFARLRIARELAPRDPQVRVFLGRVHYRSDRIAEAIAGVE